MEKKRMTKNMFIFNIFAISTRVIRSIFFNIFMLILGFVLGFGTFKTIQLNIWHKNPNYECVYRLRDHLKKQRELDKKIDKEIELIIVRIMTNEQQEEKLGD